VETYTLLSFFCPGDGIGWVFKHLSILAAICGAIRFDYRNQYRIAGRADLFGPSSYNDDRFAYLGRCSRPVWAKIDGSTLDVRWGGHHFFDDICDLGGATGIATGFAGGSCRLSFCYGMECSALTTGNGCRHGLKGRPAMEGVGINAFEMASNMGWDILLIFSCYFYCDTFIYRISWLLH